MDHEVDGLDVSRFDEHVAAWEAAKSSADPQIWLKYLSELGGSDLLPFVADFGSMTDRRGGQLTLSRWLTEQFSHGERSVRARTHDRTVPIRERLALATFLALSARLRELIGRLGTSHRFEPRGCLIYYTDLLVSAILVGYEIVGERIELKAGLAIPNPHAYLDPVQALNYATSRSHVQLVKLALSSRSRLVAHRSLVVAVNRVEHAGVFGPTIDTLFLCDWLYSRYFIRDSWRNQSRSAEQPIRALEVGCGNGLLSAAIFRDASSYVTLDAVDIDPRAVLCTHQNISINSSKPAGEVSTRCRLVVSPFQRAGFSGMYDLIVCNPPYIPVPPAELASAVDSHPTTHGTELIANLLASAGTQLHDSGSVLMVASRLAEREILAAAGSSGLDVTQETSRRVPFDIDDLGDDHIRWLVDNRGLEYTDQAYHDIAIYRICRGKRE